MSLDLNDLFYFAQVVDKGGFAAAARALKAPKSKLSRRIASLEKRLGVRLIERTTRRFRVTDVGQSFYLRCKRVIEEADLAEAITVEAASEPRGLVRVSCPTGWLEEIRPFVAPFLSRHPLVSLHILATNRAVNLIDERIDVAVRVRVSLDTEAELRVRSLGKSLRLLVASPALAARIAPDAPLSTLASLPILGTNAPESVEWYLEGPGGERRLVHQAPRFSCADYAAVREAAVNGLGIAHLPDHICAGEMAAGRLVRVFPQWQGAGGIVHLVFTGRRGLPPAVRAWIDHLAASWIARGERSVTG
jgi:DNA-binding transcriptional LysR family regulator